MSQVQYRQTGDYQQLQVQPLTGSIGAEVGNIDLRDTLSDAVMHEVHRALLEWRVIFFRDQDISTEDHLRFAAWFGELEVHPFAANKPGYPEVLTITHDENSPGKENVWHSDVTWRLQPSLGSVLRALEVPAYGGDTLFCDMAAAYNGLSEEVKAQIEGLTARHDFNNFRQGLFSNGASAAEIAEFDAAYPNPNHPVVRTHPDTGEKSLYVNRAFTKEINGLDANASEALLETLYAQARVPEYQCRFQWRQNSIAFWDNRACQHYATSDYWPQRRMVERVTVCGDTPV